MPTRHSKNSGDRHHFTHHERQKAGLGTITQRLGAESQLPFGYCALSSSPAEDPVVTPSGHIYSRESILEYLLRKSKDLKRKQREYEEQQERLKTEQQRKEEAERQAAVESFKAHIDDVSSTGKRSAPSDDITLPSFGSSGSVMSEEYQRKRQKLIDDTDRSTRVEQLKAVSPWVPQFTPQAAEAVITEPPKRPPSPCTGQPLRSKDLISISLTAEDSQSANSSIVRYICPVSRKTITNQKVYLIKSTGTIMVEQAAKDLAFPSMTCPITGQRFRKEDVLELASAASSFAASGNVEAKKHVPTML